MVNMYSLFWTKLPIDSPISMFLTLWSSEIHFFWSSKFKKSDGDALVDFDLLPQ